MTRVATLTGTTLPGTGGCRSLPRVAPRPESADPEVVESVARLALGAEPRCGDVLVVVVDGPSGAGKTTLGRSLGRRLDARVLHMDALYPGWDGLAASVGQLTTEVLEPFARGEDAAYGRWDWVHDRPAHPQPLPWTPRLVVEGCGSSVLPAGAYAAVRVWLEAPEDVRRDRALSRGGGDSYRPHWERWAAQERALFAADGTRARADLVVDTTRASRREV